MLNLTRTRPSLFIFNYKVETKKRVIGRRRKLLPVVPLYDTAGAWNHCAFRVHEFAPVHQPTAAIQEKCAAKNYIFFIRSVATDMVYLMAALPPPPLPRRQESLLGAQWNHNQHLAGPITNRATVKSRAEADCYMGGRGAGVGWGGNAADDLSVNLRT